MSVSKQTKIKALAFCGIIFIIFDVIMYNILAALRPDYNRLTDAISLLGAEGTSNADYASATFIISGILTIFFAIGLNQGFEEENRNKMSLIFLILFGLFDSIGSGVFPCDAGCAGKTPTGQMHMLVGLVGLISMCLALIFISKNIKDDERWSVYHRISKIVAIFIIVLWLTVLFITQVFYFGLFQRIIYYVFYSWIFILAIKLYKLQT